jgi:hypothetical protein
MTIPPSTSMSRRTLLSRRTVLTSCLRVLFLGTLPSRVWADRPIREMLAGHPARALLRSQTHYRVHATILLLGIPILRREDAGAASVSVESGETLAGRVVALQLAAGSRPERAAGLNRFGAIREVAIENEGVLEQAAYAGFMTSSPEKDLDQARKALHSGSSATSALGCSYATGTSLRAGTEATLKRLLLPAGKRWADSAEILSSGEVEGAGVTQTASEPSGPYSGLLYAVKRALADPALQTRADFAHNGEIHRLTTRKAPASMACGIWDKSGKKDSEFTVWPHPSDAHALPMRIDFRAKAYLRLTFEAQPAESGAGQPPELPWMLSEQSE